MRKPFALLVLLFGMMLSSLSFAGRVLPANGKLGVLDHYQLNAVSIDGTAQPTAAAIRVYGTNNLLLPPQQVPDNSNIWYTTEANGNVWKIWLISDDELAQIKQQLKKQQN
ncbi:hypothetical protein [Amantichitinum ursilacus]|uniref:Uncharacterized protein n=1 Tax=Amantichitinum ursilacus TaxID=857265 RepID=A0A0N1JRK1_9NEIS|nr:hypothetical protein [Amantichitinum ursilacus]KPC49409.1 hypothetical protein WG78_20980 [Amantichitinum ursilacus]